MCVSVCVYVRCVFEGFTVFDWMNVCVSAIWLVPSVRVYELKAQLMFLPFQQRVELT